MKLQSLTYQLINGSQALCKKFSKKQLKNAKSQILRVTQCKLKMKKLFFWINNLLKVSSPSLTRWMRKFSKMNRPIMARFDMIRQELASILALAPSRQRFRVSSRKLSAPLPKSQEALKPQPSSQLSHEKNRQLRLLTLNLPGQLNLNRLSVTLITEKPTTLKVSCWL